MTAAREFAPTRNFAAAPPRPVAPPPAPGVPTDEVRRQVAEARAAAHAEGVADGLARGLSQAEESLNGRIAALLGQIADGLAAREKAEQDRLRMVETRATRLVLALVQHLATHLGEQDADAISRRISTEAIGAAQADECIDIVVPEGDADTLAQRLLPVLERRGLAERLRLAEDGGLPPGSIHARWASGGVDFSPAERAAALDRILTDALAALPTIPTTPAPKE